MAKKHTEEMCRLIKYLASIRAIRQKDRGTPKRTLGDFSIATIDGCCDRGSVNTKEWDGEDYAYLTKKGMNMIEEWMETGRDETGDRMSPEWLARLRHIYG